MLTIRPFLPADQDAVKALILEGLAGHWGWLDPDKNPDLNDISSAYGAGLFLTAWIDDCLVGTGALLPESEGIARVVRMSVHSGYRRHGIGSRILKALIAHAVSSHCRSIVLETTSTWQDAVQFYCHHGFNIIGEWDGDTHFIYPII